MNKRPPIPLANSQIDLKSDTSEKDRLHTEIFDTTKQLTKNDCRQRKRNDNEEGGEEEEMIGGGELREREKG